MLIIDRADLSVREFLATKTLCSFLETEDNLTLSFDNIYKKLQDN